MTTVAIAQSVPTVANRGITLSDVFVHEAGGSRVMAMGALVSIHDDVFIL